MKERGMSARSPARLTQPFQEYLINITSDFISHQYEVAGSPHHPYYLPYSYFFLYISPHQTTRHHRCPCHLYFIWLPSTRSPSFSDVSWIYKAIGRDFQNACLSSLCYRVPARSCRRAVWIHGEPSDNSARPYCHGWQIIYVHLDPHNPWYRNSDIAQRSCRQPEQGNGARLCV